MTFSTKLISLTQKCQIHSRQTTSTNNQRMSDFTNYCLSVICLKSFSTTLGFSVQEENSPNIERKTYNLVMFSFSSLLNGSSLFCSNIVSRHYFEWKIPRILYFFSADGFEDESRERKCSAHFLWLVILLIYLAAGHRHKFFSIPFFPFSLVPFRYWAKRKHLPNMRKPKTIYLLTDKKGHTLATKRNTQKLWFSFAKWLKLTVRHSSTSMGRWELIANKQPLINCFMVVVVRLPAYSFRLVHSLWSDYN